MRPLLATLTGQLRAWREALSAARAADTTRHGLAPGAQVQRLALGATPVALVATTGVRPGPCCFVNLHENEQTAVQAARAVLAERGGTLLELRSRGRRRIAFRSGWRWCALDPNRIFSAHGLASTLRRHGATTARAAALATLVQPVRDALLAALPGDAGALVVAVHNNRGGRYSVRQYGPGGDHAGDAAQLALPRPETPQAFFLVTRARHFAWLRDRGFNVVLQAAVAPGAPADDGSLALWALRAGRAYVNVEALDGDLDEQLRMLQAVCDMADALPGDG